VADLRGRPGRPFLPPCPFGSDLSTRIDQTFSLGERELAVFRELDLSLSDEPSHCRRCLLRTALSPRREASSARAGLPRDLFTRAAWRSGATPLSTRPHFGAAIAIPSSRLPQPPAGPVSARTYALQHGGSREQSGQHQMLLACGTIFRAAKIYLDVFARSYKPARQGSERFRRGSFPFGSGPGALVTPRPATFSRHHQTVNRRRPGATAKGGIGPSVIGAIGAAFWGLAPDRTP
jgi:hypothetical protein